MLIAGVRRLLTLAALFALALVTTHAQSAPSRRDAGPKELRVFHIGNSVTDTIRYKSLEQMARGAGRTYVYGRHMIPGAPLQFIWDRPASGFKENPFGYYPTALAEYEWDVITLQPFDRQLESADGLGDLTHAKKFIDLALPKSPDVQVYVYQRWPRRREKEKKNPSAGYAPLEYEKQWLRKYNRGKWDGTNETRDYFAQVTRSLREAYPNMKPALVVPVGDVLLSLDKGAQEDRVPGIKGVEDLYVDGIHFNNVGAFVVGTTFYATMFKADPRGLDARAYLPGNKTEKDRTIEPALAKAIQDVVWEVVSNHRLAGVKAAKPGAAQKAARRR